METADDILERAGMPPAWMRSAILGVVASLVVVGVLFFARRLSGALVAEAPPALMLGSAAAMAAAVWYSRRAWERATATDEAGRADQFIAWGGTAALILMGVACSLPELHVADLVAWLPAIVADQFWRQSFLERRRWPLKQKPQISLAAETLEPSAEPGAEGETTLQQLFRVRDDAGAESIYGTVRAEFQPGQRHATVHVGFCPPLSGEVEIEADPSEGPDAEVKVMQSLAHGARLEVRLARATKEPCAVLVEMCARGNPGDPWENRVITQTESHAARQP